MTWVASIVSLATGNWRALVAGAAFASLVGAGAWLYGYVADLRVATANAAATEASGRAARAEERREEAEQLARDNAAAAVRMAERHRTEMAEITSLARRHEQRAETLSAEVEVLRRDPTHSAAVPAVLDRTRRGVLDRRAARARAGHSPGAAAGAGGDPAVRPAAGGAAGGNAADRRHGGGDLAGAGGGAR